MKIVFSALILMALSFSACQKEITDDVTPGSTTSANAGLFKAKIDGVLWTANRAAAASFSTAANGLPRLLNISGLGTDKKFMTITLVDSGVHSYLLSPDANISNLNGAAFQDSSLPNVYSFSTLDVLTPVGLPNGVVNVTSINTTKKTISGTFTFMVYRSNDNSKRNITEGSFTDIPYSDGAPLPAASTTDTFRVKVDSTAFATFSITGNLIPMNNSIIVQASNQSTTNTVGVIFPTTTTPGTYPFTILGDYIGTYSNGTTTLSSMSGTLQILEHNTTTKRVRGNFNFRAESLLSPNVNSTLTEGYFSVKYQ